MRFLLCRPGLHSKPSAHPALVYSQTQFSTDKRSAVVTTRGISGLLYLREGIRVVIRDPLVAVPSYILDGSICGPILGVRLFCSDNILDLYSW